MVSVLLAATLAFTPSDANLAYRTARDFTEKCTPRDAGTPGGQYAANFILDAASATGADVRKDTFVAPTPKGPKTFTNLVSEFKSDPADDWIVLVSHYDTKPGVACPGANDGASTTGLLVALAEVLGRCRPQKGNVMLLWTDGEECMKAYDDRDGFWGSKHAAAKLKAEGRNVQAVICLDMLGDKDLNVSLPRNSSPTLRKTVLDAAKRAGAAGLVKEVDELVKDDHTAFLAAGFRAVDLIDFDYGSAPGKNDYWHTERDTVDKISEQSLLTVGNVVVEMLKDLL